MYFIEIFKYMMKNYEVKYGPTGMIICINQLYINI